MVKRQSCQVAALGGVSGERYAGWDAENGELGVDAVPLVVVGSESSLRTSPLPATFTRHPRATAHSADIPAPTT